MPHPYIVCSTQLNQCVAHGIVQRRVSPATTLHKMTRAANNSIIVCRSPPVNALAPAQGPPDSGMERPYFFAAWPTSVIFSAVIRPFASV